MSNKHAIRMSAHMLSRIRMSAHILRAQSTDYMAFWCNVNAKVATTVHRIASEADCRDLPKRNHPQKDSNQYLM